jgi:hypothetical protein
MSERENLLKGYINNANAATEYLNAMGISYTSDEIYRILIYEYDCCEIYAEIFYKGLTKEQIIADIVAYQSTNGDRAGVIKLSDSILPDDLFEDELEKARIKMSGEIWEIHMNDKDTFPSNPHAHNYERQLKLHLGNGRLYRKTEWIDKIRPKEFKLLRMVIEENIAGIKLPPLEV